MNNYYFLLLFISVVYIDCQPDIRKGGTVNIKGTVHFNHSIKYIKWQKYHDGQFVDVDIHNLRYKGSTNALQNPELVINDVDTDDAVGYRLKVQMTESKAHSNEKYIKIIPDTGRYFVASALRLKLCFSSIF